MIRSPLPIFAGNWKMHHDPDATTRFFDGFLDQVPSSEDRTLAFFPPALSLHAARAATARRRDVRLGVQNVHWEAAGAFTGEVSADMAVAAGAELALVGHSERRHVFGESVEDTVKKVPAVLTAGLVAVLCVGETIDEREAGAAGEVVARQLEPVLRAVTSEQVDRLWIAYEPVWAIGTGKTASPRDAEEMHGRVRALLRAAFADAAGSIPILYGGSVKPGNAAELLATKDVDGVLVGGASLEAESFAQICRSRA